ncbi:MAG TPA: MaoC family dehydratase [Acidimicrobiia bacterium]|jgi:acyl dehydratase
MTSFASPTEMDAAVGHHLGYSEWLEITQERVNLFADATSDHQWIHVDPERAKTGPFGTTVAHGYLTLSLAVPFVEQILKVEGALMGINYGANKVRFITPVPVGCRLRAGAVLAGTEDFGGGRQVTLDLTFEIEGAEKPACVAQVVYRFYG